MSLYDGMPDFGAAMPPQSPPQLSQADQAQLDDELRQQQIDQGIKCGQLRYTPQQKQELAKHAATEAWLNSPEVPDEVRQAELPKIAEAKKAIVPLEVPIDERPLTPQEQVSRMTYTDPATGHVLIINNRLKNWDYSRAAPQNQEWWPGNAPAQQPYQPGDQFNVMSSGDTMPVNGPPPVPTLPQIPPQQAILAQQLGPAPQGGGFGVPVQNPDPGGGNFGLPPASSQVRQQGSAPPPVAGYQPLMVAPDGRVLSWRDENRNVWSLDPKGKPVIQEHGATIIAKEAQAKQKQLDLQEKQREFDARDAERYLGNYDRYYKDEEAKDKAAQSADSMNKFTPRTYEQLRQAAMQRAQDAEAFSPQQLTANNSYADMLKRKYGSADLQDLAKLAGGDPEIAAEVDRRNRKSVLAPVDWEAPGAILPYTLQTKLATMPDEQLQDWQSHAIAEKPYSEQQLKRVAPGVKYGDYQEFRKYLANTAFADLPGRRQPALSPDMQEMPPNRPAMQEMPPNAPGSRPPAQQPALSPAQQPALSPAMQEMPPNAPAGQQLAIPPNRPPAQQPALSPAMQETPGPRPPAQQPALSPAMQEKVDAAIRAAKAGDVGAQQALSNKGIAWQ